MKRLITTSLTLLFLSAGSLLFPAIATAQTQLRPLPAKLYGVTMDDISGLGYIYDSLASLRQKPITRIVFDEYVAPSYYATAVTKLRPVSYLMGEILDSAYVEQYSVTDYLQRTTDYLDAFAGKVDLWEVGNEINGEWLGYSREVVQKMTGAYDQVKARNERAALTLYYNKNCWEDPANEMFTWAKNNIPDYMKRGLDYVFVSYYEDDCNGLQPDWQDVFTKLQVMFPYAKLGIGECGTAYSKRKEAYIRRYYGMKPTVPNFVGGWFWWYGRQDFVPKSKYLWSVLYQVVPAPATAY